MTTYAFDSDDLLEQYMAGSKLLKQAIIGLSEAALDMALDEQSWTIRQIVHHVVDGDDLWKTCIKASLGSEEPFSMNWYWDIAQESWAETWIYAQREVEPSLRLLQANRNSLGQLLRCIPDALERDVTIRWPDGDEQKGTVGDVIKMQVSHVSGHIAEINRIREIHGLNMDVKFNADAEKIRSENRWEEEEAP